MEFDIEEELAGKFSQVLPSILLLALLPFVVLRWVWLIAIFWSPSPLWAGLCSYSGTVPSSLTRCPLELLLPSGLNIYFLTKVFTSLAFQNSKINTDDLFQIIQTFVTKFSRL